MESVRSPYPPPIVAGASLLPCTLLLTLLRFAEPGVGVPVCGPGRKEGTCHAKAVRQLGQCDPYLESCRLRQAGSNPYPRARRPEGKPRESSGRLWKVSRYCPSCLIYCCPKFWDVVKLFADSTFLFRNISPSSRCPRTRSPTQCARSSTPHIRLCPWRRHATPRSATCEQAQATQEACWRSATDQSGCEAEA